MTKYIVELQQSPNVWIAPWDGNTNRTLDEPAAKRIDSRSDAVQALAGARQYSPFADARIVEVLSPCPFCGCTKVIYCGPYGMTPEKYIKCDGCGVAVWFDVDLSRVEVVAAWNRRVV